jgi:sulfur-carrier protein
MSAKMHVSLFATFRLIAGVKSLDIDLPEGSTVQQVVEAIVDQLPVLRRHWLREDGQVHAHVHIFINGEDVQNLAQGMQTRLDTPVNIDFLPPVAGG